MREESGDGGRTRARRVKNVKTHTHAARARSLALYNTSNSIVTQKLGQSSVGINSTKLSNLPCTFPDRRETLISRARNATRRLYRIYLATGDSLFSLVPEPSVRGTVIFSFYRALVVHGLGYISFSLSCIQRAD